MKIFTRLGITTVAVIAITNPGGGYFASAAPPPPVRYPQACAPDFCVEVIPQSPYSRYEITTTSNVEDGSSTLIVKLRGGVSVGFHSKGVDTLNSNHDLTTPEWRYDLDVGTASACLVCKSINGKKLQVIGIAMAPIPHEFGNKLSNVMDVCFWPLDMRSAGYGTGHEMSLGDKICVDDTGERVNLFEQIP